MPDRRFYDLKALLAASASSGGEPSPAVRDRMADLGYFLDTLFNDDLKKRDMGFALVLIPYDVLHSPNPSGAGPAQGSMMTNIDDPELVGELLRAMAFSIDRDNMNDDIDYLDPVPGPSVPAGSNNPEPPVRLALNPKRLLADTFAARWAHVENMMTAAGTESSHRQLGRGMFYIGAFEMLCMLDDDIGNADRIRDELMTFAEREGIPFERPSPPEP